MYVQYVLYKTFWNFISIVMIISVKFERFLKMNIEVTRYLLQIVI